ncbi:carbohydrate porin [Rhodopseudomonas sp. B29]|uniref:carbohydrate porin n=1 Tax=Rhodopseudomonas sp. B29 TaxID=95607 RepID=UPI001FCAC9C2|nr:carbohydrate porin [Rhodopseudomonas sp. B29]
MAAPAVAGDLAVKAPAAEPFNWAGFYVGGHFDYTGGRSDWSAPRSPADGSLSLFSPFQAFKGTGSYAVGLQAGYNLMLPSGWLIGVEADLQSPNTIGSRQQFGLAGTLNYQDQVVLSGTARGRLGYALPGGWLPYATAGFAWSYERLGWTDTAAGTDETALLWRLGWAAGVGVEVPVAPRWSARLEYLATGFGRTDAIFPQAGQRVSSDMLTQNIRLGLNYQLGAEPLRSDLFTKGFNAIETDRFAFHGQSTFTWQYAPSFRSPYRGTNSLTPNQARQTFDATFYIGAKLWDGAEFWINPEIDQGFGLSGTFGVAAFPSAESYKVGSSYPYARMTRYFVRQTLDLGEATETVAGAANQFAGKQSSERIVITAGKFSVGDIFDTNKYAHDPRSDFLNWGLADILTFDYAADAWAFTYGTAAEWYTGPWTFRAGLFDLPVTPNSTDLDPAFGQFQMVGEIERRYSLWGRAGKIAVTGFLNRARLGRFDTAVRQGQATATTPDISTVRTYTSKTGVSANLEQELTDAIGLFARAGFSSPNLETNAFSDSDRSVSAGVSVSGKLWNRPDDTFGLAGLINHISAARIAYLDAGGLTAIIGDGRLPNPGNENVVEAYYSLPVYSWKLTADYQFIANPAFNRDRGPVHLLATRLHTQF